MTALQIIGIVAFVVICIVYILSPCSLDHDAIGRQGADKCPKCKKEI